MFRQRYPDVHILTRETNTREQIVPLSEGALDLGLLRNTQLPDTGMGAGAARTAAGDGAGQPSAGPPALGQLAALAREPFVFSTRTSALACMTTSSACCAATATRRRLPEVGRQ